MSGDYPSQFRSGAFRLPLWFLTLGLCLSLFSCNRKRIRINEISLQHSPLIQDEQGDEDDWVELYNASALDFDLAGHFLTDNLKKKDKWKFPDGHKDATTIPAWGYLVVWLDKDTDEGPLHAGFRLDNGNETLYLIAPDGKHILDSVKVVTMPERFTLSREKDGSGPWVFIRKGTPLSANAEWRDSIMPAAYPEFSTPAGNYQAGTQLELSSTWKDADILFTTDGSLPIPGRARVYVAPLSLDTTCVIRARIAPDGYLPGPVYTATYFINESSTLPVISLVADPHDLWDKENGLYTVFHRPTEIPGHFEYFSAKGNLKLSLDLGTRISGYTSRALAKKSFRVIARGKYGPSQLQYRFFKDIPNDKFGGLIIRADASCAMGGGPHERAGERIKNEVIWKFNREMGSTVDMQSWQPVNVYLNGKYWGLYTLMERKAGEFIRNHHDVKEIDMLDDEDLDVMEGDAGHYDAMIMWMNTNDIRKPEIFARVEEMMDVDNFIDNWIYNIYMNSFDHEVNTRSWRPRTENGKWRWIAFDKDGWGEADEELLTELAGIREAQWNLLLGRLLQNMDFRNRFINRTCDYLNTVMLPDSVAKYIDAFTAALGPEKHRDRQRWMEKVMYEPEGTQIAWLKEFALERPGYLRDEMRRLFGLKGQATITLKAEPEGAGHIRISTLTPASLPWSGIWMQGVPLRIEAVPAPGYVFSGWEGLSPAQAAVTEFVPDKDRVIIARFTR